MIRLRRMLLCMQGAANHAGLPCGMHAQDALQTVTNTCLRCLLNACKVWIHSERLEPFGKPPETSRDAGRGS